jgi:alpha,alpha-trehalase
VFCMGRLLEAVQSARLSHDSKTFVDMPMVMDPAETRAAFAVAFGDGGGGSGGSAAPPPSKEDLAAFVSQYFFTAGSDTVPHVPADFTPAPPQLAGLANATLRAFALGVHDLWLQLGRRIIPSVHDYQQRFSLLWQPHPLIVPGGRCVRGWRRRWE